MNLDIGQKVRFVPGFAASVNDSAEEARAKEITGKVIYVDRKKKKFTVSFGCGGTVQCETFKFSQAGKNVKAVGGGGRGRRN